MGKTHIQWTDETWNPTRGCSLVSAGCTNCYAMKQAHRFSGKGRAYEGLTRLTSNGPVWTGEVRLAQDKLEEPLHWKTPRRVFVNSMSDLFHEGLSDEDILKVFAVMRRCYNHGHTFQILTKRAERMASFCSRLRWNGERLGFGDKGITLKSFDYIHLGVSVEDQKTADERIPWLLKTPAAVRFVSYEPALGAVDFSEYLGYNPVYETLQSRGFDISGRPQWRVGDSGGRNDLARQEKGVGSLVKEGRNSPLQACSGRELDGQAGVSSGPHDDRRHSILLPGSTVDLVSPSRPNPRGPDGQSQERDQDRQPPKESGAGDPVGTAQTCLSDWSEITGRSEESCGSSNRQGNSSNPKPVRGRTPNAEGGSGTVQRGSPNCLENSPGRQAQEAGRPNCGLHPSTNEQSHHSKSERSVHLDQIIVGGESGPGARPMHPDWARSVRDQCVAAGVPFFFKQRGNWSWDEEGGGPVMPTHYFCQHGHISPHNLDLAGKHTPICHEKNCSVYAIANVGKKAAGRLLDGREWSEYPLGASQSKGE